MSAWVFFPHLLLLLFTVESSALEVHRRLESILHVALHYIITYSLGFRLEGEVCKLRHAQIKCPQESLELWVWWEKGRAWIMYDERRDGVLSLHCLALEAFMKGGSYDDQVVTRWEGTFGKVSYTRGVALYREAVRVYLMREVSCKLE